MLCGQLAALGVRRVDAAERTGPGLLTVAAAARAAGDRVLICAGAQTVPGPVLARLLGAGGTAAVTRLTAGTARSSSPGSWLAQPCRPGRSSSTCPTWTRWPGPAETLAATQAGPDLGTAVGALIDELGRRGVTVRILDAGPDSEGAVTQLLADPAARDMARWAAWRRLTPAALYGISLGLGLVAAVWFAELDVRAKLLAIPALAGSFLFARTGSLVAATSRDGRISPLVGWLATACGLLTEPRSTPRWRSVPGWAGRTAWTGRSAARCVTRSWPPGAVPGRRACGGWPSPPCSCWASASWPGSATSARPGRRGPVPRSVLRTLEQAITFPAGERYAVIVLTSVFFGPRLTFLILLGWGVLGAGYLLAGQIARSARAAGAARSAGPDDDDEDEDNGLAAYRGDGVLAHWAGALVNRRLPPLPPVLVGLLVTGVLAALGLGEPAASWC